MSRALYRTYRSKSFQEVVGQSHVTDLLENAISSHKIAHAYLLTGPRGVGKTSVARIIAHRVNGLDYSEDQHLDIIEIDAASNRRIDDIRDLREKIHIAPVNAQYKVYIIDEVHMLTGESFNALLKTLEEPPEHAIFILATTEVHKLPATIISRTQRYHLRPASSADICSHLAAVAAKEAIEFEPEALELIALHAGGSFRDSLSLLDQLSGLSQKITQQLVESVLGMAQQTTIEAIIDAIDQKNVDAVIAALDTLTDSGVSSIILTDQLSRSLQTRARTSHHLYEVLDALTDVPRAHDPALKLLATLVRFSKPASHPKTVAADITKAPTVAAKPATLRAQHAVRSLSAEPAKTTNPHQPPASQPSPKETVTEQPVIDPTPSKRSIGSGTFEWDTVLTTVKKHYAPLYSVLSRAQMEYDESTQTLSLTFAYVLHRKKLENNLYRKQLGAVIHDLFGINPELAISDTKSKSALDENAQAVAAIMGGGEPVNGTI